MKNIPSRHLCQFCCRDPGEVELLLKSKVGGLPAAVCSVCVGFMAEVLAAHRKSPGAAAVLVEAHNRVAALPVAMAAE